MHTLKRLSVPCPENESDLFMFLYHDTQPGMTESGGIVRDVTYDRMWLGYVDRDRLEFDVCRAQAGIFTKSVSRFRIKGKIKRGIVSNRIELEIGFGFPLISEVMIVLAFTIPFLSALLMNIGVALLVGLLAVLFVLYVFDDFFGSEELIVEYLKDPIKVSKLSIKK